MCDGGEESSVACINYILGTTPEVYIEETGHNATMPMYHCTTMSLYYKKTGYSRNAERVIVIVTVRCFGCIARCVAVEIFNMYHSWQLGNGSHWPTSEMALHVYYTLRGKL